MQKNNHLLMEKVLYFSDYFKPIANKLKFAVVIAAKFLKLLFKRRKRIELLQLAYSRKYLFDKSYLAISYKFKNALWYNFKDLKKTTENKSVVFDLKNIGTNNITLIVYGFFRKKIYHVNFQPEKDLETKSFKTIISGLNQQNTFTTPIKIIRKLCSIKISTLNIEKRKLEINHSSYTQTDFV